MDENSERVNENTVKYYLFPKIKSSQENAIERYLKYYTNDVYGKIGHFLTEYLWHSEPFNIKPVNSHKEVPHLEGSTYFGENIEDEWFIVFLLIELTKLDPDLVVKVEDDDGDFLLIEAANYLPKWVTPKKSENRVYLYRGALHIVPLEKSSNADNGNTIDVCDAIKLIRDDLCPTECDSKIQSCIDKRISVFPRRIQESKQKVKCFIPASIVALLQENPSLISHAIAAFYARDAVDLKACRVMKYFPPENRVMAIVTMTRCQYAQLLSQKFKPDFKVGWNIPSETSSDFKSYDLGMKIACGFEVLVASSKRSTGENKSILNSNAWNRFISSLEKYGYFKNMLPGSKGYDELKREAETYFKTLDLHADISRGDVNSRVLIGNHVLQMLDTLEVDYDRLRKSQSNLEEDNDDWMTVTSGEFDQILKESFQLNASNLSSNVTEAIKSFVQNENAGLLGAEFPKKAEEDPQQKVDFNAEAFEGALSSILSFNIPHSDSDASSSGMSDYDGANQMVSDDDDDENEMKSEGSSEKGASAFAAEMKTYMEAMDRELAGTKVGQSFEKKKPPLASEEVLDSDDEYEPVDVDVNALKNILESYKSQAGLPGPAGNILSSMGVLVPPDTDD